VTRYLVDDLNPTGYGQVVEEIVSGAVTRQYTYGLQRISENQVISSAWTPSFYGYDGGGTVRQLTSIAGAVTDTYEYDAWGNEVGFTGTTPNNYLYRAEQYDPDLGLYYLRARYYNPVTGRFLSRDPEDPQLVDSNGLPTVPKKLHKYLYAYGDPVNVVDPNGRAGLVEYVWTNIKSAARAVVEAGWVKHFVASCLVGAGVLTYLAAEHPSHALNITLAVEATGCSLVWLYGT
jgi:RHS repeat-associated protein